jgi:hypothetical protein
VDENFEIGYRSPASRSAVAPKGHSLAADVASPVEVN